MFKGFLKSKTMWSAALTSASGAALMYMPLLQESLEPKDYGLIMIALGVSQGILRVLTTKPLEDK